MANQLDWKDFMVKIADYTGLEKEDIKAETNLYSDLGLDSLGLFSLGMYLIKEYQVQIPLASVATIETVNDIFNLMNEQVAVSG